MDLKKRFIYELTQDMRLMNGSQFEEFCGIVFEMIIDASYVEHKGLNLLGKPVRKAVDHKNDNCDVVAQCGTDSDYFTNKNFKKPINDIESTKKNNPLCKKLFLFSNQRATDACDTRLKAKIHRMRLAFDVEIWDAEKIANYIYDRMDSPQVQLLWDNVPFTKLLYDLLPKKNKIPHLSSNYSSRKQESEFMEKIKAQPYVQVYGISGIGKTDFVIKISNTIYNNFDAVYWIDGSNGMPDFENVKLYGNISPCNLTFSLNTSRVLIIIDNLNIGVENCIEEFERYNKNGSRCIITSQKKDLNKGNTFALDFLSKEESEKLIDSYKLGLSRNQRDSLLQLCNGYPLLIKIIASNLKNNIITWDQIRADINIVYEFDDAERDEKLCDRIIGKIYKKNREAINAIALINAEHIARDFYVTLTNEYCVCSLIASCIIKDADIDFLFVHKVVLESIKRVVKTIDTLNTIEKLCEYLDNNKFKRPMGYSVLLLSNKDFIDSLYMKASNEQKKIIYYAKLQVGNILSNGEEYIQEITHLTGDTIISDYDIYLLIEKSEIEVSLTPKFEKINLSKGKAYYIESLLSKASNNIVINKIKHHAGKFFLKAGVSDRALALFNSVLESNPQEYGTILQLARINKKTNIPVAKKYINQLLSQSKDVPLSTLLASYEFVSAKDYQDLFIKYICDKKDDFRKLVLLLLKLFSSQIINTLGCIAYKLDYRDPELMDEFVQYLPDTLPVIEDDAQLALAYAFLYSIKYKHYPNNITSFNIAEHLFQLFPLDKDYKRKRYMELYILAKDYGKALSIADEFDDKNNAFYYQDMAKAFAGIGNYDNAIISIDNAINSIDDCDYKSSFIFNKACFQADQNNPDCLTTLNCAKIIRKDSIPEEWFDFEELWKKMFL